MPTARLATAGAGEAKNDRSVACLVLLQILGCYTCPEAQASQALASLTSWPDRLMDGWTDGRRKQIRLITLIKRYPLVSKIHPHTHGYTYTQCASKSLHECTMDSSYSFIKAYNFLHSTKTYI